ncbi:hypothetical protein [Mammaliicoccus sp. Dog046]|uniref:hypothetical protein n=1 Tax=Mammaliicoccus sp. Dog046 TaxID=3034233 RepID=UPI002B26144C|nr:hypothetical protein [Mammaliicoccus sp. Dog046]WQK85102.1 hypothetical protein P3U32_10780 [Mammaliicoccus sp. Dog046]
MLWESLGLIKELTHDMGQFFGPPTFLILTILLFIEVVQLSVDGPELIYDLIKLVA